MPLRDIMAQAADDLVSGFGLLSRLPLPQRAFSGARSVWVWPLVGAVIGAAAGGVAWAGLALGLPPGVTAAAVMATTALLTGAMHEDGLADSADGLFGGWTPERRLEIMKDSRIGSYGMLALMITGLARWSALTALLTAPAILAAPGAIMATLIAAAALSRAPMAVMMALMPGARQGGLSAGTGRPGLPRAALTCALALAVALAALGPAALPLALAAAAPALLMAGLAQRRIGGQTGDILGAAQHLAETAILITASTLHP